MNDIEDTFMEVMREWEALVMMDRVQTGVPQDLRPLRQALHAHAVALVAAKREIVGKLRGGVPPAADPCLTGNLPS